MTRRLYTDSIYASSYLNVLTRILGIKLYLHMGFFELSMREGIEKSNFYLKAMERFFDCALPVYVLSDVFIGLKKVLVPKFY